MTDILFGQSYFMRFDPKLWDAMQPFPPLGTLYAAAVMKSKNYSVAVFDAMLSESEKEWEQAVINDRPQMVVLFEDNFNYLSKMCLLRMRQAAFEMIRMARCRDCIVVVAGADATDNAEQYINAGADYVLLGEGEMTLAELADHLFGRSSISLESILGIAFQRDGRLMVTQRRPEIRELDKLPFPAWDLIEMERYKRYWLERHGKFCINLVTTRGCPFHCNWCAKPIWGQRYHSRSPENVVAEIQQLHDRYRPDSLAFADDIFGLIPGWTARFAREIENSGLKIPFKCLSRADLLLRDGEIDALQRAGSREVWIGAESGSQRILDAMEKGTRVEQIRQAADRLRAAGIRVGFFLQFGYPGERRDDIQQTLQMVRDCRPDDIGISVSYPLPGTKFYSAVREQIGHQANWHDSDDLAMLYRGPFTTDYYRQLHRVVHYEFRRDRAWRSLVSGRLEPMKTSGDPVTGFRLFFQGIGYSLRLPFERRKLERLSFIPNSPSEINSQHLTQYEAANPSTQPD